MKLLVLETILESRTALVANEAKPPYVCHLPPKRAARLRRELESLGTPFGLPLSGFVPAPREPEEEWSYMGIVLGDVHVYGRVPP